MSLKFILFYILFLFLFVIPLLAQTTTFSKTYPELGDSVIGFTIDELIDHNFIISGYRGKDVLLTKINKNGEILWSKNYEADNKYPTITKPLAFTSEGNMLIVGSILNQDNRDIYLLKINFSGDTLWSKKYGDFSSISDDLGLRAYQLNDGGYLLFGMKKFNFYTYYLIVLKTTENGFMQWNKEIKLKPNFYRAPYFAIEKISENMFAAAGRNEILIINSLGEVVSSKYYSENSISTIGKTINGDVLVDLYSSIERLDPEGNVVSIISYIKDNLRLVQELPNGNLFLVSDNKISEIDKGGNTVWQNLLSGIAYGFLQTTDNGFIITGSKWINVPTQFVENLWLLKVDSKGFYKSLELESPRNNINLELHSCQSISWFNTSVDKVNLLYSTNNGTSWNEIISNLETINGKNKFSWQLPDMTTENSIMRIENSDNPTFSDTGHFSITYNPNPYPGYEFIAANEIKMWISNNGDGSYNPMTDGSGFYWPGGFCGSETAVFEDGLVYGGKINNEIYVGGSSYRHGFTPGIILNDGTPSDPNDPQFKIWKINKNWAAMGSGPIASEYRYDYENWPGQYGAPYIDVNGDCKFTQGIDKPKFIGDEVLYYVANDLDSATTNFVYGSPPIGLEFHVTVWGYNSDDFLKDVVFKKYQIINKSNKTIDGMYFSYWCDDDLGDANDDYVGCDTTLSLGYSYNGDNDDQGFYGINPPAVGHLLVQGPIIKGELSDSAKYKGKWRKGYKNLGMTAFTFYIGGSSIYSDPDLGSHAGSVQFYNYMQGRAWNGTPFINPNTGDTTAFCLAGDPVEGSGWYEGPGWPGGNKPGDRRYSMTSGPVTMAPGDTQEVIYAIFMAQGSDNIHSLDELKNTAKDIQYFYDHSIYTDINDGLTKKLPTKFELYQNYPNPFNPTTIIKYEIPGQAREDNINVSLKIYDVLGREVAILVNKKQKPGRYKVEFDAKSAEGGLPSGVYFYRLKVYPVQDGTRSFIQTRKMLLIK